MRQVNLAARLRLERGQRGLFGRERSLQLRRLLGAGLQAVELGERLLQLLVGRVTGQLDAELGQQLFQQFIHGVLLGEGGRLAGLDRLGTQGRQRLHTHHPGIVGDGGHAQLQGAALGVIGEDGGEEAILFGGDHGGGPLGPAGFDKEALALAPLDFVAVVPTGRRGFLARLFDIKGLVVVVDEDVLTERLGPVDQGGGDALVELPVATRHIEGAAIPGLERADWQQLIPTVILLGQLRIEHGQPQGGGSGIQDGHGNRRWGHHSHSGWSQQKSLVPVSGRRESGGVYGGLLHHGIDQWVNWGRQYCLMLFKRHFPDLLRGQACHRSCKGTPEAPRSSRSLDDQISLQRLQHALFVLF